jgi:hypothetical protein
MDRAERLLGVVTSIGKMWTKNGDGYLVIQTPVGAISVAIIGFPSEGTETKIILKTVKSIKQLRGKSCRVTGIFTAPLHVIAEILEEV